MPVELLSPLAGWCMPLNEVPDPVFADAVMGPGIAIDPTGDRLCAPCAATILSVHPAGHALTLRTDDGLELLLHLGIDTVQLSGEGFHPLVAAGQRVVAGAPLIAFDLDLLVQRAPAMVSPIIVSSGAASVTPLAVGRAVAVGEPLLRIEVNAEATDRADISGPMIQRDVIVALEHGLHARPCARIAAALRDLESEVTLVVGDKQAAASSSVAMLGLALRKGDTVNLRASGLHADRAIELVTSLLQGAGEPEATEPRQRARAPSGSFGTDALRGIGASPGLAIGSAFRLGNTSIELPETGSGAEAERARLSDGIAKADESLRSAGAGGAAAAILGAHREILADPQLRAEAHALIVQGMHSATAFMTAAEAQAVTLRQSGEQRISERADDLVDVAWRVARAILHDNAEQPNLPPGSVIIADNLLPSQLIALPSSHLAGIALAHGGPTSHVAILAAGMGVPMVVALGDRLVSIKSGVRIAIDGDEGALIVDPKSGERAGIEQEISERAAALAAVPVDGAVTRTADGTMIGVFANLGSAADARIAAEEGAEGCGLLRSEFLFLDRDSPPDEQEQAACYREIGLILDGRPLVIRLLDAGGDKPAPYLHLPAEENPALGERGIRLLLGRPELLQTQLRAIVGASGAGDIRVMIPMVAALDEFIAVRDMLRDIASPAASPPLGLMIETPAAAVLADRFAEVADFLSIGSNDLTQYALAMDRGNPALSAQADGLHPAVLRLIDLTCRGAATNACPVSVCGGLAADALAVPILLGLGVRTLSVPPKRVRATKAIVAATDLAKAEALARSALDASSASEVRDLSRVFRESNR